MPQRPKNRSSYRLPIVSATSLNDTSDCRLKVFPPASAQSTMLYTDFLEEQLRKSMDNLPQVGPVSCFLCWLRQLHRKRLARSSIVMTRSIFLQQLMPASISIACCGFAVATVSNMLSKRSI